MTLEAGKGTSYRVDDHGFLVRPEEWNEDFAVATAPAVGITGGLTEEHWKAIRFVRSAFEQLGQVPLVYVTCVNSRLRTRDLKRLFPSGYHRGVCRLAGVSYRTGLYNYWLDKDVLAAERPTAERHYRVDALGFLVDPTEWDESFARNKAAELKMSEGLTDRHWAVIRYLRDAFAATGTLPTVIATCEDNGLEIEDLERLFPDGYHRGAVKLAGLRFG